MPTSSIYPTEVFDRQETGQSIQMIDVRTPLEFREIHAEGARNVPLDALDPAAVVRASNGNGEQPLYVICRSGNRGQKACEKFQALGYENVANVEGGLLAWEAAGLPVVRGKKTISLERQVRIAAGLLVFVGSLLAYLVHPYFVALPAFVGAGLVFAGVTDTCGMGMLIARMPWNQVTCEVPTPANASQEPRQSTCCG